LGGASVVAGDHDQVETELLQRGDRGGGVGFDGVGDGQDAGGPAVDGCQYGCLALCGECGRGCVEVGGVDACVTEQPGCADEYGVSVDSGLDAFAGDGVEPGRCCRLEVPGAGRGDDGGGEWVFAVGFGGRYQGE
jgi:hypothetical protein